MKVLKLLPVLFSLLLVFFSSSISAKDVSSNEQASFESSFSTFISLDGTWMNTDPKSVPKLFISGNSSKIRAWGKCHPTNCDWGTVKMYKYGAGFKATFVQSFGKKTLLLNVMADGRLKVNAIFTYNDSRPTKRFTYYFKQRSTLKKIDGTWANLDPKSLPKLYINGNSTRIRAWGKCHPTNCDWGTVALRKSGNSYRAIFNSDVAKRTLILTPVGGDRLKVSATYDYHDSRPTKRFSYYFKKATASRSIDGIYANLNPNALPKLHIYGNGARIRAWGKCSPTNCDWGVVGMTKIGNSYRALFNDHVAKRTLIITPASNGRLKVSATYNYHDSRPTKRFTYYFKKSSGRSA